jgi:asparagine synthase (glutamine-hydrolysing)
LQTLNQAGCADMGRTPPGEGRIKEVLMFRYIALIWNTVNQRQSEAALLLGRRLQTNADWQEVINHGGMRVLCADARSGLLEPHLLGNRSGVVLGQLFERNRDPEDATPAPKAHLGIHETAGIVNSRGKRLISEYWGNYVAFLHDPDATKMWVVKDPCGALPCYSTVFREVTIFFSCIADCVELRLLSFSINPAYLKNRVVHGSNSTTPTTLNEVSRVRRGDCVEIDPRHHPGQFARHLYWNPLKYSESDAAIEDPDRAARTLRSTVRSCTHALAGCHESLLHRLSGGLDSSIVIGCLSDAPSKPRITAYTYYNPRSLYDERPWAQLAAFHIGCDHVESALGARDIRLATMHRMRPAVAPASVLEYVQRSLIDAPLAAEREATAIFTGDGGGSGFCANSSAHAVSEYLHRHGLRPEAFRIAAQVALGTDRSRFTVFSNSLRGWLLGSGSSSHAQDVLESSCLVNPDVAETLAQRPRYPQPWYRPAHEPWNSIRQLEILPTPADFYNAVNEPDTLSPEIISPFYSQPAIELCLRIPLYVHFEDGRDRGLARRAFSREVPRPILRRMRKERMPGLYGELVRRNRDFLRELLLDGVLIGEGLLSRTAVENALSGAPSSTVGSAEEIFRHLDTEMWARRWTQKARRAASPVVSEPLLFVARGPQSR